VQAHDANFVLLRQAAREIRAGWCDVVMAQAYAHRLPTLAVRCRWLAQPSPFARHWTQPEQGEVESLESPAAALQRLHVLLLADPGSQAHAG
jgi:Lhr-like helicase